jgi:hypothetical protein
MAEYAWRPLGELLVQRGLIDEYQLESLLLEQRLSGKLFGELLVGKRVVSPMDMAAVIAEQHGLHLKPEARPSPASTKVARKWRPLGRILVHKELLTESGLQRVLLSQRRNGGLLGQLLLERGYVTPEQLAGALAEQHGLALAPDELASAEQQPFQPEDVAYEVHAPNSKSESALHVTPSFLDASDFAFELLYDEDPDALEIVEVKGDQRRIAWSYERPAGAAAS